MNQLRRHQLNALRAVEAAGRLGSLARAAEELGVTVGAVSQHLRNTELQIGQPLFTRSQKGLAPTQAGERLLAGLTAGFREIEEALSSVAERDERVLVVTVAPVLAYKWLVPRLSRFHALRPGIQVRIDASVAHANFDANEADVGIRVGEGGWPRVRAKRLVGQTIFPVCSPKVAEALKSIGDLARTPVIRDHGSRSLWDVWLASLDSSRFPLGAGPTYSDSALCLDAAISGQGVMMAWHTLALDALRDGKLVAPFEHRVDTGAAYWLVTSARIPPSPDVRAFGAWVEREFAAAD
jgi:LysR family transcriptional regulator, glycine cleavage system transcriptional activator